MKIILLCKSDRFNAMDKIQNHIQHLMKHMTNKRDDCLKSFRVFFCNK